MLEIGNNNPVQTGFLVFVSGKKSERRLDEMKKLKKLQKMIKKGFRGYPVATIAFYGPDDKHATKVAVGIVPDEHSGATKMERWHTEKSDIRSDYRIGMEILEFIKKNNPKSVVMAERIMGCPHEEGVDYPEGTVCPECPFWSIRDRFTGEIVH